MKKISIIIFISLIVLSIFMFQNNNNETSMENNKQTSTNNKMTLVLAAPSIHNEYYQEYFEDIVKFQKNYADKIIEHGKDDVRIIVDRDTKKYYLETLPAEILIENEMYDIWMRDFATVNPKNPIQFVYTDASMPSFESRTTQKIFNSFAKENNLFFSKADYVLDGGNIVDNYKGRAITTTRFLRDNNLDYDTGKEILRELLFVDEVAIIEPDDDILAHADGMVAWIDDDVLAVNSYSSIDAEFDKGIMNELKKSFPDVKIIRVPVQFDEGGGVDTEKGIGSACGVNLNLVSTYSTLYIPVFGNESEKEVLDIIRSNTKKDIKLVDANTICLFGGSVRCTTWQTMHTFN